MTPSPVDKDGIGAAVMMARIAATAKADGRTIEDLLDGLAARFGRHRTAERAVRLPPADGRAAVEALRRNPPTSIGSAAVTEVKWIAEAGLLRFRCGEAGRVQVRPSGTEPKVKVYAEVVDGDPEPLADAVADLLRTPSQ